MLKAPPMGRFFIAVNKAVTEKYAEQLKQDGVSQEHIDTYVKQAEKNATSKEAADAHTASVVEEMNQAQRAQTEEKVNANVVTESITQPFTKERLSVTDIDNMLQNKTAFTDEQIGNMYGLQLQTVLESFLSEIKDNSKADTDFRARVLEAIAQDDTDTMKSLIVENQEQFLFKEDLTNALITSEDLSKDTVLENSDVSGKIEAEKTVLLLASKYFENAQLKTKPSEAYFWSGNTNGVGGKDFALEYAVANGGTTLEKLMESQNIEMPIYDLADLESIKVWDYASKQYAKQASGVVKALIGKNMRDNSVWKKIELPNLIENINVTKIIVIDPETLEEKVIYRR